MRERERHRGRKTDRCHAACGCLSGSLTRERGRDIERESENQLPISLEIGSVHDCSVRLTSLSVRPNHWACDVGQKRSEILQWRKWAPMGGNVEKKMRFFVILSYLYGTYI